MLKVTKKGWVALSALFSLAIFVLAYSYLDRVGVGSNQSGPARPSEIRTLDRVSESRRSTSKSLTQKKSLIKSQDQVDPNDVVENSAALVRALAPNAHQPSPNGREKKQEQLAAFLAKTGTTGSVRQTKTASGELKGIYGEIPFNGGSGLSISQQKARLTELLVENGKFFGIRDQNDIGEISINCTIEICTAHVEKDYTGLPSPGHQMAFSYKEGSIFAVIGSFELPKLSLEQIPSPMGKEEVKALVAKHVSEEPDVVLMSDAAFTQTIETRGGIDFFGERWEEIWIEDLPYKAILNSSTKKVVAVLPMAKEIQVEASGVDLFGNRQTFNAEKLSNTNFSMVDQSFPFENATRVFDFEGIDLRTLKGLLDSGELSRSEVKSITSTSASDRWDPAAVTLLINARDSINYYKNQHNFDAIDPTGLDLTLAINAGKTNAAMHGSGLAEFGVGAGVFAGEGVSFARAADVVGHEINHGVISATSGLNYERQSGALNESYSDFFGAVIENKNWLLGEDLLHPSGLTVRNMANPADALLEGQPSHMSQYRTLPLENDLGGVHKYSGIHNRALYLIADGLSVEGLGTSIGVTKVADLAFRTMTGLTRSSNFDDAANLLYQNAVSKYGDESLEAEAVLKGMQATGLLAIETSTENIETDVPFEIGDSNAIVYLRPFFGADEVPNPHSDFYYVYIQVFQNAVLSFNEELSYGPFNGSDSEWADYSRPTLVNYQDGTYKLLFKGKDAEIYIYGTDYSEPVALDYEFKLEDVSYSPDGKYLTWLIADSPYIYVYNYDTEETTFAYVALPSTAEGGESLAVDLIDTVRFDPTSRKIAFDYLLCDFKSEVSCDEEDAVKYWSVGVLDVSSMSIDFPLKDQPSRYDIGFPAFSNLSDRYLAVDLVDSEADTESGLSSAVYIYDLEEKTWEAIVSTDGKSNKTGFFGTPSFSADDSSIVFAYDTDNGPLLYAASIENYALADSEDPFSLLNPNEASMPYVVPGVSVEKKPSLTLDKAKLQFGDVVKGEVSDPATICAENLGQYNIAVGANSAISEYAISGLFNSVIEAKQKKCVGISLNTSNIEVGSMEATYSLSHDGLNAAIPITLSAYVDHDTDSDGTLNYKDTDDDNDEVLDVDDAFPLDATESVDTDGDGTGNNADSDDDDDSLSDVDENSIGTNPLAADTDADGVADNLDDLPLDETEVTDTDGDGIGNNADDDDDGDFLSDSIEVKLGTNPLLRDSDADGVDDNFDALPLNSNETADSDEDGVGNNADLDDDNDGFSDEEELTAGTDPLSASSCPGCFNWDIDDDGESKALTDGLIMIRHLFGFNGDSLTAGAIGSEAGRATSEAIASYLADANAELDIDGDGESKALTDGLLLIRYLFGFSGDSLISGAIGNGAERNTAEEVEAYIEARLPSSP